MYARKFALSLAKQTRTCPPQEVRNDSAYKEEWKQHLEICPYCSDSGENEITPWEELGKNLSSLFFVSGQSQQRDTRLQIGQLCKVKKNLCRWRGGRYYNAPLVLVIAMPGSVSDNISVAQTYDDINLAGPGDLILSDKQTASIELFVETWNLYTLRERDLEQSVGKVNPEIIEAVKNLEKDQSNYPDWALQARPFMEHDVRTSFRELEVEVGYTFASLSDQKLIDEYGISREDFVEPKATPDLVLPLWLNISDDEFITALRNLAPDIFFPISGENKIEMLAAARFPDEYTMMAAADDDHDVVYAKLLIVQFGRIVELKPLKVEVRYENIKDGFFVNGFIPELPGKIKDSAFYCFFIKKESEVISTSFNVIWSAEEHSFHSEFNFAEKTSGRLQIVIALELEDTA